MGNTCGCADSVEKSNELSIEQDEIKRRMNDSGATIDNATLNYLLSKVHLIVRIQALQRGREVRKKIQNKKLILNRMAPRSLLSYASVDTNQAKLLGTGKLPGVGGGEEAELEFRPEYTFKNGAVYKGQWHGE